MTPIIKYIFLFFGVLAPTFTIGQQYLIVQKNGEIKNFKYEVNDELSLQTKKGDFHINGTLTQITDSSLVINSYYEIKLKNIASIFRQRKFIKGMSGWFFIRGGIAYTAIVGINGIINNDSPLIDEQTLIISASMIVIGIALKPFITKKMDLSSKWHLKVLDFDNIENAGGW